MSRKVWIGAIAKVGAGQGAPQDPSAVSDDGYPFIRAGSLDVLCMGGGIRSLEKIGAASAKKHRMKLYPKGTVVFAKSGMSATKNRVFVLPEPAYVVSHLATLEVKSHVDPNYLRYFWESYDPSRLIQDPAYPSISLKAISRVEIELPPLPEQKRIAAILAKADRLRRLRRFARELSDTYLQSVFLEMFHTKASPDWPRVKIASLAKKGKNTIRTGPFGSQLLHSEFVDEGIAVLGIDNAVQNRFVWRKLRFITEEKYQQLKRYTVFPGDLIITIMATTGRCAIIPDDIPLAINTKHLCCMTLDQSKCLPTYLKSCFLTHPSVLQQLGVSERGAVMPGLNMGIIKNLLVPLPPLSLQQQYAHIVHKLERLRAQQREAERQAEHLFQTLLHRAFLGEL